MTIPYKTHPTNKAGTMPTTPCYPASFNEEAIKQPRKESEFEAIFEKTCSQLEKVRTLAAIAEDIYYNLTGSGPHGETEGVPQETPQGFIARQREKQHDLTTDLDRLDAALEKIYRLL